MGVRVDALADAHQGPYRQGREPVHGESDASIHGWESSHLASKQATDTNYKRMLSWAMTLERTCDPLKRLDKADVFELQGGTRCRRQRRPEMLGMATGIQEVALGRRLSCCTCRQPREFDAATTPCVVENARTSCPALTSPPTRTFARERDRFPPPCPTGSARACPVPNRFQELPAEAIGVVPGGGEADERARRPFPGGGLDPAPYCQPPVGVRHRRGHPGLDAREGAVRHQAWPRARPDADRGAPRPPTPGTTVERAAALYVGVMPAAHRGESTVSPVPEAGKTIDQV